MLKGAEYLPARGRKTEKNITLALQTHHFFSHIYLFMETFHRFVESMYAAFTLR
jgi:hypothetical protein